MKYILIILCFWFFGCEKLNLIGKSNNKQIKFKNLTLHKIEIQSYPINSNSINNSFTLKSNEELIPFSFNYYRVLNSKLKEIELGFISFNPNGNYVDSVIVIFDDSVKIKHNSRIQEKAITNITFWNSRNITNGQNYKIVKLCDTKHDFEAVYYFTFIEQDYLEAKANK